MNESQVPTMDLGGPSCVCVLVSWVGVLAAIESVVGRAESVRHPKNVHSSDKIALHRSNVCTWNIAQVLLLLGM